MTSRAHPESMIEVIDRVTSRAHPESRIEPIDRVTSGTHAEALRLFMLLAGSPTVGSRLLVE